MGLCETGTDALDKLPIWRPDVVLLDLDLGQGPSGLDVLSKLARALIETRFLILTVSDDPNAIFEAALRGACGYLRKSIAVTELPTAVREVYQDEMRLSPEVLRLMWNAFQNPRPLGVEVEKLSPREAEALELLAQGFSLKDVAVRLNIGLETVRTYARNIRINLNVRSTDQAVKKVYPGKLFSLLPRWIRSGKPSS